MKEYIIVSSFHRIHVPVRYATDMFLYLSSFGTTTTTYAWCRIRSRGCVEGGKEGRREGRKTGRKSACMHAVWMVRKAAVAWCVP